MKTVWRPAVGPLVENGRPGQNHALLSAGRRVQGEQVIPAFWAKAAPQKQTDNSSSKGADTSAGYGFGLWRCKGEAHAYRADGLFSQFGIVFEDYDAVLVMTRRA